MNKLIKKIIILVICCGFINFLYSQQKTSNEKIFAEKINYQKECVVSGEVFYPTGLLPHTEITFKGQQTEKTVFSNDEGSYNIKLPAGIYEIILRRGADTLSYKRSKLNISCQNDLTINLYPQFERISYGDKSPEHKFILFSNQWTGDKKLNPVISYLSKEKKGNTVSYTNSMLTYDNLTVSANKLIQDIKNKSIVAEGNVWIEEQGKRTNYKKLTLKFSQNGVEIEGERLLFSKENK